MSKVALYFRRWKNYSRQKNADEDWAFVKKHMDFSDSQDENGNENDSSDLEIFRVKFLGCTAVDAPKSDEATARAIRSILSMAKSSNKKMRRLNLSVCPKGIETFDAVTGETLHQIAMYQISYCSADAAHSNVFAFIACSNDVNAKNDRKSPENLMCYAFVCAKRKIAYNLTITVAKNFERAFELWKKSNQLKKMQSNGAEQCESARSVNHMKPTNGWWEQKRNVEALSDLIDFDANANAKRDATPTNDSQKQFYQSAWVPFGDKAMLSENQLF